LLPPADNIEEHPGSSPKTNVTWYLRCKAARNGPIIRLENCPLVGYSLSLCPHKLLMSLQILDSAPVQEPWRSAKLGSHKSLGTGRNPIFSKPRRQTKKYV
jgi:hypothetical protein